MVLRNAGDILPSLWDKANKGKSFVHGDRMERLWCTGKLVICSSTPSWLNHDLSGLVTLVILIPLGLLKSVSNLAFTR
jgi:hypothetical protein